MYNQTLYRRRKHFYLYCLEAFTTAKSHVKDCFKTNSKQRFRVPEISKYVRFNNSSRKFSASKYWSPGHPVKILFDHQGDVLKWHPEDVLIWHSRGVPGRLIWDVPRTFSGCSLKDLQSTQTCMYKISSAFQNVSFRTYSIVQIYIKAFKHSRCIENTVKLVRWPIFIVL